MELLVWCPSFGMVGDEPIRGRYRARTDTFKIHTGIYKGWVTDGTEEVKA
jgi:hypothetical protein